MLVLSRYEGQEILIGRGAAQVTVRVVELGRHQVKLGVTAPSHLEVDRAEVREAVLRNGRRTHTER